MAEPTPPADAPDGRTRRSGNAANIQESGPNSGAIQLRILSFLGCTFIRAISRSLRLRVENDEIIRRLATEGRGALLVAWHGRIFLSFRVLGGRGFWALVSISRDGEMTAQAFQRFGFRTIRGSSGRRGAVAARDATNVLIDGGVVALTPDGPRGPARKVQAGAIYFAQRSGCAVVPIGNSAWPRWQVNSWDKFIIPRPFGRAVWIFGEPLYIAPDEDPEEAAARVGDAIDAVTREAESRVAPAGADQGARGESVDGVR